MERILEVKALNDVNIHLNYYPEEISFNERPSISLLLFEEDFPKEDKDLPVAIPVDKVTIHMCTQGISPNVELDALDVTANATFNIIKYPTIELKTSLPPQFGKFRIRQNKRPNIMQRSSYQARMGRRLDRINRRIMDNSIRLSSHPTDMIRISTNRDSRSQDVLTRTITSAEVVPIILPQMKDIPLRKFSHEGNDVLIPSLYPFAESTFYEIYAPVEVQLDEDDILIRLIYEDFCSEPYIMALQVKDILSTIGYSSILYNKIQVTFYDEELPKPVKDIIRNANEKREELGW